MHLVNGCAACVITMDEVSGRNYAEAVKWYRKAAEQGNANAQKNLGVCYEKGLGVSKDQAEADKWFHKAAEQKTQ